ncbi:hypothetical protein FACS1894110_09840 [Spirochaetia bacterium]|nr:hypothetical protein FACS1894110_09840 [Spirochaetia bacterium]
MILPAGFSITIGRRTWSAGQDIPDRLCSDALKKRIADREAVLKAQAKQAAKAEPEGAKE